MPPMLCLASLPKRVLRGARASGSKSLAATHFARATHSRVHPSTQLTIAPASNPHQPKSYVLPTFYGLEDITSEFRAHEGPRAATEPAANFALEYFWNC